MNEDDYIKAQNLTRLCIAERVLRDCCLSELSLDVVDAIRIIEKEAQKLYKEIGV